MSTHSSVHGAPLCSHTSSCCRDHDTWRAGDQGKALLSPACRLDLRGVASGWPQDCEFDRQLGAAPELLTSSAQHDRDADLFLSFFFRFSQGLRSSIKRYISTNASSSHTDKIMSKLELSLCCTLFGVFVLFGQINE